MGSSYERVRLSVCLSVCYGVHCGEGRVHLEGPARDLLKNDEVRKTYLGI